MSAAAGRNGGPRPRALVLRSAGTNCDGETVRALELAGAETDLVHLNELAADRGRLERGRILVVPGGFSYGDYVAAGRVLGAELRHRLADPLHAFVEGGGRVLGICNGFQVLVELGLLQPGRAPSERSIALTGNASGRFECRWVQLAVAQSACSWLEPGTLLPVPVAHREGRFVVSDERALAELFENRQVALAYADPRGPQEVRSGRSDVAFRADRVEPVPYPWNPNGSVANIAGVCDPSGRVLGLMPHPERNLAPWNHPRWNRLGPRDEGEGLGFFRRLVDAARAASPAQG